MTQLTLRAIRTRIVALTHKRPVISRAVTVSKWPLLLIDVETDEGVTGRTYLSAYTMEGARTAAHLLSVLEERFKGQPVAPVEVYDKARKGLFFTGYEGLTLTAVSGLDMALWDAASKAAGLPLVEYLGGVRRPVKAYNSCALWLKSPEETAEEAIELRDEGGFSAVKMRLGREDPKEDVRAIEAVMQAVANCQVFSDYNQLNTMDEAIERIGMIEDLGLGWVEEPIRYDDLDGAAELTRRFKTPIQIGENFWGPRDLLRSLQMKASTYVMPDLMRIGGVTGWMRAAGLAGTAGTPFSSHLFPEVSSHMLCVTESAHWLEWADWCEAVLAEPYKVENGFVTPPDRPGTGIEWDEDAVKAHLVE
ncbi:MAG: enolase C-terminal domain-like protein [Pseudomonadota bacterium]